jgi:hypothetical protein
MWRNWDFHVLLVGVKDGTEVEHILSFLKIKQIYYMTQQEK